jgi:hypothetical protein
LAARKFVLCSLIIGLTIAGCGDAGGEGKGDPGGGDAGGPGGAMNGGEMDAGGSSGATMDGSPGGNNGGDGGSGGHGDDAGTDSGLPMTKSRPKVQSVAPPYSVAEDKYKYEPKSDQGETPAWTVKEGPAGMTVDEDQVAWTPTKEQAGTHKVKLEGMSKNGDSVEQEYYVTVSVAEKKAQGTASVKDGGNATVTSPTSSIKGAQVKTKPGAVDEPVDLTVSELDKSPPMVNKSGDTKAVQFGPSGQVFNQPAMVALPLANDMVLDRDRIGAFVYNKGGRWDRVRVVNVDLENRLVFARASHFSVYAAAQSKLDMGVTVERMPAASSCEGKLVARSIVSSPLSEVESTAVNNASALQALIEGGATDLEKLITHPDFEGSLRFVRVATLRDEEDQPIERRIATTTLYAPGDGSAIVRHTRPSGALVGEFEFTSLADELASITPHLTGVATHMFFDADPASPVSASTRWHIVYFADDVGSDATDVENLGLAAVDVGAGELGYPDTTGNFDRDCDRLTNGYDAFDDSLVPTLVISPEDVVNAFTGEQVALRAEVIGSQSAHTLNWSVTGGMGTLAVDEQDPRRRLFTSSTAGQNVVTVTDSADPSLSADFVISVTAPPKLNTKAVCRPSTQILTGKVSEAIGLSATVQDAESSDAAMAGFPVVWGLVEGAKPTAENPTDARVLVEDGQLSARSREALLNALSANVYRVGCRADDGTGLGPIGEVELTVLEADDNRSPEDAILSPPSATRFVSESVAFEASAIDPDGDALTFTWSATGGTLGTPVSSASSSKVTLGLTAEGIFEVSVSIDDGHNAPVALRAKVQVYANQAQLMAVDADGDGYPAGAGAALDCDDANPSIHPAAIDRCGNEVDEDCSGTPRSEDCDEDGFSVEAGDCDDSDRTVHPGARELCDDVDNDCDEGVDEDFYETARLGQSCSVGIGACQNEGVRVCAPSGEHVVCAGTPKKPGVEICDGIDNDCDGLKDEGLVPQVTTCGIGACGAQGTQSCVDGKLVNSCKPGVPADNDATCNAVDDDCDGKADEDFKGGGTSCGVGACLAQGTQSCVQGSIVDSCVPGQAAARDDSCNDIDNDCDGRIDEDFAIAATTCGVGACVAVGQKTCALGQTLDSCKPLAPLSQVDDSCNGVDDDCDGSIDDDAISLPEVCNGKDDDCDGSVDENLTCTPSGGGTGECTPTTEICNGLDDDCDGLFDETNVCGLVLSPESIVGVWWHCTDVTCSDLRSKGNMFLSNGTGLSLQSFDGFAYNPNDGPYCAEGPFSYTFEGGLLSVSYVENGESQTSQANVQLNGEIAQLSWLQPAPADAPLALRRMPEQAGGACPADSGGPQCQPEPSCGTSRDDNCNQCPDDQETACGGPGCATLCACDTSSICNEGCTCDPDCGGGGDPGGCQPQGAELCNGLDENCDGAVDEGGVCGDLSGAASSLVGIWFECAGAACDAFVEGGLTFVDQPSPRAGFKQAYSMKTFDRLAYDGATPYCIDGPFEWSITGSELTVRWFEGPQGESQCSTDPDCEQGLVCRDGMCRTPCASDVECTGGELCHVGGCAMPAVAMGGIAYQDIDHASITWFQVPATGEMRAGDVVHLERVPQNSSGKHCYSGGSGGGTGECSCDVSGGCDMYPDGSGYCGCDPGCGSQACGEYENCDDPANNDCDTFVDDASDPECLPSCVEDPAQPVCGEAGETCQVAIAISEGLRSASFTGGQRNDLDWLPGSSPSADRLFWFDVPATDGKGSEIYLHLQAAHQTRLQGSVIRVDGWTPGTQCPASTTDGEHRLGTNRQMQLWLDAGRYLLVVEGDAGASFELTFASRNADGSCSLPDGDADGLDVCAGDCNDTNDFVHPPYTNAQGQAVPAPVEACDGVDNDCNGSIDDIQQTCTVQGQFGPCTQGRASCDGSCQQLVFPASADYCADGVDNDCSGDIDPATCLVVQQGDVCNLPLAIEEGSYDHTLEGFNDLSDVFCGDGYTPACTCDDGVQGTCPMGCSCDPDCGAPIRNGGGIERFYRLMLPEPRTVRIEVRPVGEPQAGQGELGVSIFNQGCGGQGMDTMCGGWGEDHLLPAGEHVFAVFGHAPSAYHLLVSSYDPIVGPEESCLPSDFDGDGQTLCTGDCNEGDDFIYPGAEEVCDGLDNNCDGQIDKQYGECSVETNSCGRGRWSCNGVPTGSALGCAPLADNEGACATHQDCCSNFCAPDGTCQPWQPPPCDQQADEQTCHELPECQWDGTQCRYHGCAPDGYQGCGGGSTLECCSGFCDASGACAPYQGGGGSGGECTCDDFMPGTCAQDPVTGGNCPCDPDCGMQPPPFNCGTYGTDATKCTQDARCTWNSLNMACTNASVSCGESSSPCTSGTECCSGMCDATSHCAPPPTGGPGPGETCQNPILIGPGSQGGTLEGATDDVAGACGNLGADRVYRFDVPPQGAQVLIDLGSAAEWKLIGGDCMTGMSLTCGDPLFQQALPAGPYWIIFEGQGLYSFDLQMTPLP